MTLREQLHQAIETLDTATLYIVYEQLQRLNQTQQRATNMANVPSLETVLSLTAGSSASWSEAISGDRRDRL